MTWVTARIRTLNSHKQMTDKNDKLEGLKVLLCVSGGIAAYKAVELASKLTAANAKVQTIMTQSAQQLVGAKSFEAVTHSPVYTDLWASSEIHNSNHISLSQWADIIVVAPATANTIGKMANAICDNLLSTMLCVCWQKPTLLAPAMNDNMWNNPAIQKNVETLRKMKAGLIGPEKGRLACGSEGIGRMAEPQDIIDAIKTIAVNLKKPSKSGG